MSEEIYTVAEATIAVDGEDAASGHARLVVYHDAESELGTRMVEIPEGATVTFGRSRRSTVYIDSERVSRGHARLARTGTQFTIEDLGSRNGTRVNGSKITEPTRLRSGDEIVIGPVTAVLTITSGMIRQRPIGSTSYFEERLAAEVDRGQRFQRRFALIMLRLDGEPSACEQGISRIAGLLRPMDILAEYGLDDLALILPESDASSARVAAQGLLDAARGAGVEAHLGLAFFPDHGSKAGVLVTRVGAALRSAQNQAAGKSAAGSSPSGRPSEIAEPPVEQASSDDDVIVGDPQMERVFALVRKVADHAITVLINGETGVGKEVVAGAIHRASRRRAKPYVRLNCASIPETLLESELFGHEKGAFTGADRRKVGYFEAASGGTIFLDEIGEIRESVQTKLLRVLEEHKIVRVGGTKEIDVDVRVVCATNRDLEAEVGRGAFREDLFFRISAFTIVVPPLRDRPAEIALLARHFLKQSAGESSLAEPTLSEAATQALAGYSWPGNVRELRNAMERALVLHTDGVVEIDDLPDRVRDRARAGALASGDGANPTMRSATGGSPGGLDQATDLAGNMRSQIADVERATIVAALDACGGNQTRTAKKLGLSRRALIYKMEKYGLKPPPGKRR